MSIVHPRLFLARFHVRIFHSYERSPLTLPPSINPNFFNPTHPFFQILFLSRGKHFLVFPPCPPVGRFLPTHLAFFPQRKAFPSRWFPPFFFCSDEQFPVPLFLPSGDPDLLIMLLLNVVDCFARSEDFPLFSIRTGLRLGSPPQLHYVPFLSPSSPPPPPHSLNQRLSAMTAGRTQLLSFLFVFV